MDTSYKYFPLSLHGMHKIMQTSCISIRLFGCFISETTERFPIKFGNSGTLKFVQKV